jgi:hypothetical protein
VSRYSVRWSIILFVAVGGALAGCQRPPSDDPVDVYLAFAKAARKGDAKNAFAGLTQESQEALRQKAEAASQAGGKATQAPAEAWFLSLGGRTEPVGKVELVSREGERAKIRVTTSSGSQEVSLRKETGGWKVDVTSAVEERNAP